MNAKENKQQVNKVNATAAQEIDIQIERVISADQMHAFWKKLVKGERDAYMSKGEWTNVTVFETNNNDKIRLTVNYFHSGGDMQIAISVETKRYCETRYTAEYTRSTWAAGELDTYEIKEALKAALVKLEDYDITFIDCPWDPMMAAALHEKTEDGLRMAKIVTVIQGKKYETDWVIEDNPYDRELTVTQVLLYQWTNIQEGITVEDKEEEKETVTVKNNETIMEEKQEADWKGQMHLVQRVKTESGVEHRVDGTTCVIFANRDEIKR